jgi:hypothetical protein
MKCRLTFFAQSAPWFRGVEFWITTRDPKGYLHTLDQPLRFKVEEVPEGELPERTAILADDEARDLMDALWAAGVRPTESHGYLQGPTLTATLAHLEDMRAIVSKKLGTPLPERRRS